MTAAQSSARVVIVTGASGAGRTTAINALEDIGFEAINNIPLTLLERVFETSAQLPPMAIGIDVRNRDFSVDTLLSALTRIEDVSEVSAEMLFLDCRAEVLVRRYSETRRRHPLAPQEAPEAGIERELTLLAPLQGAADHLIDTSDMTPHDLRAEIGRRFGGAGFDELVVSVESFSYKRGLPRGVDMIFDVRFLKNPHWEKRLRTLDGRNEDVADYVAGDDAFAPFFDRVLDLVAFLLPAFKAEGKTHFSVGIGCTGGQHRSVTVAEKLSKALAETGWRVSTRHRELERRGEATRRHMG